MSIRDDLTTGGYCYACLHRSHYRGVCKRGCYCRTETCPDRPDHETDHDESETTT